MQTLVVKGMEKLRFTEELMEYISNMNSDNSVFQFFIPGKGKFTLVLQEEDQQSICTDVELLKSLSPKDFV